MVETCTIVRLLSSTKVRRTHHRSELPAYRMGVPRIKPAETLTKNLKMLLTETGMDIATLSKISGVSKRMIQYILTGERKPTIEIADDLANAFHLDGWALLMPELKSDLMKNGRLAKLVKNYLTASQEGREYIEHVAEKEAEYNKASNH